RARIRASLFTRGAALRFADCRVEPRDSFRDRWRIVGKLDQLVSADTKIGEHWVGEDLSELGRPAPIGAFRGKRLHIHVERLGEAQEDAGGDWPLIALKVIEIGTGNAQFVGHLALVEPALTPQPLEARAKEELALHHIR